jgi:hypothetical protein
MSVFLGRGPDGSPPPSVLYTQRFFSPPKKRPLIPVGMEERGRGRPAATPPLRNDLPTLPHRAGASAYAVRMANKSAQAEQVYAALTGVLSWSRGRVLLREGQVFAADDPVVLERPDIFSASDPSKEPRTTTPPRPKQRCWTCYADFEPTQGHQRYCSAGCRRARERWLAKVTRWVRQGESADPARPGDRCSTADARAWAAAVEARLMAVAQLGRYLDGYCHPGYWNAGAPPAADPDIDAPRNAWALRTKVGDEVKRLDKLRDDAHKWVYDVEISRERESDLAQMRDQYGPGSTVAYHQTVSDQADGWVGKLLAGEEVPGV